MIVVWLLLLALPLLVGVIAMALHERKRALERRYARTLAHNAAMERELELTPEAFLEATDRFTEDLQRQLDAEWVRQWEADKEGTEDRLERAGLPRSWAYAIKAGGVPEPSIVVPRKIGDMVDQMREQELAIMRAMTVPSMTYASLSAYHPVHVVDNVTGYCLMCGQKGTHVHVSQDALHRPTDDPAYEIRPGDLD